MGSGFSGKYSSTYGSIREKGCETEAVKSRTSLDENAKLVSQKFSLNKNGFFGEQGKNCRVFRTKQPIEDSIDFYEKLGKGGVKDILSNGHGTRVRLSDGTWITHRIVTSTKGSPAVEINLSGSEFIKNQKIHFIMED